MKAARQERRLFYRVLLMALGLSILALSASMEISFDEQIWAAIAVVGFVAFLANFPLTIFLGEINVISVVTLASGMIFGIPQTIWIIAIGTFIGYVIRRVYRPVPVDSTSPVRDWWFDLGFNIATNIVPLTFAFMIFGDSESVSVIASSESVWKNAFLPSIVFVILHGLLLWLNGLFRWGFSLMTNRDDLLFLLVIELLPVPLLLIGVEAYPYVGNIFIVAIGGIPAVIAVLLYGVTAARADLQKRVQELSTLSNVSQTLRSSLNLDSLLEAIQEQVMRVLGVDSFYVALVDVQKNRLWYPLAVRFGERVSWTARRMMDRLTDRVIRNGEAIMLTPQIQSGPNPIGLPPSEAMPKSWLGVPLITPERVIGCLAVFETLDGVEFTQFDLDLLTTLSAPVSIAIQNALLYDQVQERAAQLETLYHLTGEVTASLELDAVLSQICQAVAQVGGSQRSAIYLYDPGEDKVHLASYYGLSDEFAEFNKEFSIGSGRRTRCMRAGKVVLTPNVPKTSLAVKLIKALRTDGIQAFAAFPLITPDDQIGFLSVFHPEPHDFLQEEVDLLQTFAAQAALAVSNAQLHTTTDKQLSRRVHQLAILEAVGRELSAASTSEQLFPLILNYAIDFTQAPLGGIITYDFSTSLATFRAKHGYDVSDILPLDKGITLRALATGKVINVGDVREDSDYFNATRGKTRSQLSVPISHEDHVLGVITLESFAINAFSKNEQALVEQLANQAAIALVNANLYRNTQRHLNEQSTLFQVTARLVEALDEAACVQILCSALKAVAEPNRLGIYILNEDSLAYELAPAEECNDLGWLKNEVEAQDLVDILSGGIKVVVLDRIDDGQIFLTSQDVEGSFYLFPMRTAQRLIGFALLNFASDSEISENLIILIEAIVVQAAIAIQNAQLFVETTQRREQLSAVINSVAESIVMVNSAGIVTLSNQPFSNLAGLPSDQISQTQLKDLPDVVLERLGYRRDDLHALLEELAEGKIPVSTRDIYQIPNIESISAVERSTHPVMGTSDLPLGWMIVWRDVTEEHKINQEREAIADALIHDLRSPISAVLGSIDLLDESIPEAVHDELIARSLQVARRGAKRVLRLIKSLLDVARMQSGRIELERSAVDLSVLIPQLLMDIEIIADEYSINLKNEVTDDIPVIFVDEDKISRVIVNLLDNAVKFSPENSEVRVVANLENDSVAIQIWDQGPGISEENRVMIFERFSQISGQFGRWRGAGLGLAFSRLTVEAHGGKIWVEPPPDGQGSVFTLTLPLR